MSARRTQIYLDENLRRRIDRARAGTGETMADVVRAALVRDLERRERATRPLAEMYPAWVGAWRDDRADAKGRGELPRRAERLGY